MLARVNRRTDPDPWSATSSRGMVVTAHYLASLAGAEMLARDGDAVDAAVAASLVLGVCEPAGSGLGGMALMVIHRAETGRSFALVGACTAPQFATPADVAISERYRGHCAVAVPGHPAVIERAHDHFGRLSLEEVFTPAVRWALDGYPLTPLQHALIHRYYRPLAAGSARELLLDRNGRPLGIGTLIRQPLLAETLRRLAREGIRDFYEGEVGRRICADMERNGGLIRESDLQQYAPVEENELLRTEFDDLTVVAPGPPAGGITLMEMLNLMQRVAPGDFDPDTPDGAVLLASVVRACRQDRRRYRLKTGATSPGEAKELLSARHARKAARRIAEDLQATGETSHVCVADRNGNLVSLTQSIERTFGAAEIARDLGFLYNGYLRGFKVQNPRHPHYLRPGAVARSNACPTVLLKNGEPWGAVGNTGSERLASGILQVLLRLRRQTPFEAVLAPRLHCSPERVLTLEEDRFESAGINALVEAGFELNPVDSYAFQFGGLNLIVRTEDEICGVTDPRRDGLAIGPA